MCKILCGINKNAAQTKEAQIMLSINESELEKETDGIGVLMIDRAGHAQVQRAFGIKEYQKVFDFLYKSIPQSLFWAVHTRTATSGETSLLNFHFFQVVEKRPMLSTIAGYFVFLAFFTILNRARAFVVLLG